MTLAETIRAENNQPLVHVLHKATPDVPDDLIARWAEGDMFPLEKWMAATTWAPSPGGALLDLFRAEHADPINAKRLASWTDSAQDAKSFGERVIRRSVPYGAVLAIIAIDGLVEYVVA